MASSYASLHSLIFISSLLFAFLGSSLGQQSFRPKAVVLPVTKDPDTRQYLTRISQRTPLVPLSLVVDLGGFNLWVVCDKAGSYVSSTFRPSPCGSAQCSLAAAESHTRCGGCNSSPAPGCNNNTCYLHGESIFNSRRRVEFYADLGSDVLSLPSTDGSNPGRAVTVPKFLFLCGYELYTERLAKGAAGIVGLSKTKISLPSQLSSAFSFARTFAICLSSSTGVMFFGDGPYNLLPNIDTSQLLVYTPMLTNPVSVAVSAFVGEKSYEYFIGVQSIAVGNKPVHLDSSAQLAINKTTGSGGTKISTINPYTVLRTSIFTAVTNAFISEAAAMNITRVATVSPFGVCFSSKNIIGTRVGPAVPYIYLTLQNKAVWTITGSNSMVQVNDDVLCLGFIDIGEFPTTSIVIGAYQLEDRLIQFDLATSKIGLSGTLFASQTTCANFNFTMKP